MKNFTFLLCLFPCLLFSSEFDPYIPLSDIQQGLPTVAAGCVNVISGDYVESHVDMTIPGPKPLTFERFYSSGSYKSRSLYQGWHHNHDSEIETFVTEVPETIGLPKRVEKVAYLIEKNGRSGIYDSANGNSFAYDSNNLLARGTTNCQSGTISARTNIQNSYINRKSWDHLEVYSSTGTTSQFHFLEEVFDKKKYLLSEERYLNRTKIRYKHQGKDLALIETTNTNDHPFASIKFHPNLKGSGETSSCTLVGNNGSRVTYLLEKYKHRTRYERSHGESKYYHITEVQRSDAPTIKYNYVQINNLFR